MKRVELAIDVYAPVAGIWAVLTDPAGFPEWITGIQSVELLTEGDYGVGTRYHVTAGSGNNAIEWTVEITGIELEQYINFSYSGDVEGTGGWLIEPREDDEGYWVTSFDEFAPPGNWLVKLLSRFWLDNAARAARRESLECLKERVESGSEIGTARTAAERCGGRRGSHHSPQLAGETRGPNRPLWVLLASRLGFGLGLGMRHWRQASLARSTGRGPVGRRVGTVWGAGALDSSPPPHPRDFRHR
jgi:uncharacterized membrane protein